MLVENQSAIVTGGSSGMGSACVKALRARLVKVVSWDKTPDEAVDTVICDVTSEESVANALEQTIEKIGVPRILINCAGIAPACRVLGKHGMMPLDLFNQVLQVNLVGTFQTVRQVSYAMLQQDIMQDTQERGVIINTASIAAFEGQIGQVAYSASKGGIVSMTLPLAREMAQHAIRVNTIAPGLIATPMLLNMPEKVQSGLKEHIAFPKRFGTPQEFASLVMHILENTFINGEVIRLDGGLRMMER